MQRLKVNKIQFTIMKKDSLTGYPFLFYMVFNGIHLMLTTYENFKIQKIDLSLLLTQSIEHEI